MNKFYLLGLGLLSSVASIAQVSESSLREAPSIGVEQIKTGNADLSGIRGTESCSDTVDYALYRSIDGSGGVALATVVLEDSASSIKGMGLYFPMASGQTVSMSGLEFLAYGLKADGTASSVTVSVYLAGADSLPAGPALATNTISVDTNATTFGDITQYSPLVANTIPSPFVITIEAGSPTDSLVLFTSGAASVGGQFEDFPTEFSVGGNWIRPGASAGVIGNLVPRVHPVVSYSIQNSLTTSTTQLSMPNEVVNFATTSPEIRETYLTLTGLFTDPNRSSVDFGDGNIDNDPTNNVSNTYVDETQDYTVVKSDTVFLYNFATPACVVTETVTIAMANPSSVEGVEIAPLTAVASMGMLRITNADQIVKIYSITGALVSEINTNNTTVEISTSDFSQGVYLIQSGEQVLKIKL